MEIKFETSELQANSNENKQSSLLNGEITPKKRNRSEITASPNGRDKDSLQEKSEYCSKSSCNLSPKGSGEEDNTSKKVLRTPIEKPNADIITPKEDPGDNDLSTIRARRLEAVLGEMLKEESPEEFINSNPIRRDYETRSEPSSISQAQKSNVLPTKKRRNANFLTPLPLKIKEIKNAFDTNLEDNHFFAAEELRQYVPFFMKPENIRDADGNFPTDPGYDPSTLFVPDEFWNKKDLSTTQKQYWELKAQHFDKILLFKYGKFYEIYYDDAIICNQLLGLNWVGNRLQVGVAERSFDFHVQKLVEQGYKIAVVEQLETSRQMDQRVKNTLGTKKSARLMRRATVQLLSKGTFAGKFYSSSSPRYLMAIKSVTAATREKMIGVSFVDITSNITNIGIIFDDEHLTQFKTLIAQTRPAEIVYQESGMDPLIKTVLSSSVVSPMFSRLERAKYWSVYEARIKLISYFGNDEELWPEGLRQLEKLPSQEYEIAMSAFGGCISYLKKMLIFERIMDAGRFFLYDPRTVAMTNMILDSQALEHLEIYRTNSSASVLLQGSLFNYINRTRCPYGERLLKSWILAPLLDSAAINDRLDAIEDLHKLGKIVSDFRTGISQLPDLERDLTRLYNYGYHRSETPILFEDISVIRLREYQTLLNNFRTARHLFLMVVRRRNDFKSQLLRNLTNFQSIAQLSEKEKADPTILPDPIQLMTHFGSLIQWEQHEKNMYRRAVPRPGVDTDYDQALKEANDIHREFDEYLMEIRKRFSEKGICYANAKYRYELEFPEAVVEGMKKPPEFEFTSKKKHFQRFHTKKIKQLLLRLEDKEELLNHCFNKFLTTTFRTFGQQAIVWNRFVNALAQIDCLASLAILSVGKQDMVRPLLFPLGMKPFIYAKGLKHPYLRKDRLSFVPNDVALGFDPLALEEIPASQKNVLILTGPNMGGKSTLLRQVSIAAILAQIGCYVPAKQFRMSIVDRIFTRMGASDNLMVGKSTFYIELEETATAIRNATENSLIVMDELGRGTSTFDGFSIAYGILKHLVEAAHCRVLFATHYAELIDEFEDIYDNIGFYFMDYYYDSDYERIVFKYKLTEGRSPDSFGMQVAVAAGIPSEIIESARPRTEEFEKKINLKYRVTLCKKLRKSLEMLRSLNSIVYSELEFY